MYQYRDIGLDAGELILIVDKNRLNYCLALGEVGVRIVIFGGGGGGLQVFHVICR